MITGEQIKAGRAMARIGQGELAQSSGLSVDTIKRLEGLRGPISANTNTESALRTAFDSAGVVILDGGAEGGPGIRLKKHDAPDA